MATESNIFDFYVTDRFWKDMNRSYSFDINNMGGTNNTTTTTNWEIIGCKNLPSSINSIIDSTTGCIHDISKFKTENAISNCSNPIILVFNETNNNNGFTITVSNKDITLLVPANSNLQGFIIYNKETRYLLAYSRLSNPVKINGNITLSFDGPLRSVGNCTDGS